MTRIDASKPHHGRIYGWRRVFVSGNQGAYLISGTFTRFDDREFTTSLVMAHEGTEIETRNSRYTLMGGEGSPVPWPRHGPWRVLVDRSIRGTVEALAGTLVYPFASYDYGCASDDTRGTGLEHVAVTLDPEGGTPFFTIPACTLRAVLWPDDPRLREKSSGTEEAS